MGPKVDLLDVSMDRDIIFGWLPCLEPPTSGVHSAEQVADEELLLDYRLSPGLSSRPGWYFPVSTEEEDRRWA